MKREAKHSNTSISWHADTAYILECSAVSIHATDSCRSSAFKDVDAPLMRTSRGHLRTRTQSQNYAVLGTRSPRMIHEFPLQEEKE
jgi:predicted nuclease with RNAse H fold